MSKFDNQFNGGQRIYLVSHAELGNVRDIPDSRYRLYHPKVRLS